MNSCNGIGKVGDAGKGGKDSCDSGLYLMRLDGTYLEQMGRIKEASVIIDNVSLCKIRKLRGQSIYRIVPVDIEITKN